MEYRVVGEQIEVFNIEDFDIEKTFECGQCFRWNREDNGTYVGIVNGRLLRVATKDGSIFLDCSLSDFNELWFDYFDLGLDYKAIRNRLSIDDYMTRATEYGTGIRILRQDGWETLCSFIISQCNNIPRIKSIVEKLCVSFGDVKTDGTNSFYAFPTAEKIASLTADELSCIKCGYRAPYLIDAAKAVIEGSLNFEELATGSVENAIRELKRIKGVGDKVANCVVLFGLHMYSAFPIDVWIKRVLSAHYSRDFDPSVFGEYAGIAQQYMFYYAREEAIEND